MGRSGRGRSSHSSRNRTDRDAVSVVAGENVAPTFLDELAKSRKSIKATIYTFDHDRIVDILREASQRSVDVQLLFDDGQMRLPSCKRQFAKVALLVDAGVQVRTYTVPGRGYGASLHSKTFLLDSSVLLSGSPNATRNAFENNWECLLVVKTASAPKDFERVFEDLWHRGVAMTAEKLKEYRAQAIVAKGHTSFYME